MECGVWDGWGMGKGVVWSVGCGMRRRCGVWVWGVEVGKRVRGKGRLWGREENDRVRGSRVFGKSAKKNGRKTFVFAHEVMDGVTYQMVP